MNIRRFRMKNFKSSTSLVVKLVFICLVLMQFVQYYPYMLTTLVKDPPHQDQLYYRGPSDINRIIVQYM